MSTSECHNNRVTRSP